MVTFHSIFDNEKKIEQKREEWEINLTESYGDAWRLTGAFPRCRLWGF
jgi:hypothetical protein